MQCLKHGEVGHVSTVNNTLIGAIHFLSCGCFGTAEQLRDPNYDPNPPAVPDTRVTDLEAKVAALEAQLAPPVVATPAAVAHADEVGVDLAQVEGSGVDGTILKADVVAAAAAPEDPELPAAEGAA